MSEPPLKPGWRWVKFGEVVRLNTERCADPVAAGIERYVGLDHIEPEDLRIRRWGQVADGTTFTNRFRPGQVLFGKRRAYQRKVAVADFDGVCSGDIYIFESKDPAVLLPELLPFICQTEGFFEHAVGTSAGSLSPRTNWTQLAQYEFALPPLEEQRRITSLLAEIQLLSDAYDTASLQGTSLLRSLINTQTTGRHRPLRTDPVFGKLPAEWPLVPLRDAFQSTQYGLSLNANSRGKYPILGMTNIEDGQVIERELAYVDISQADFDKYKLQFGDVLFNRTNSYELVGRTGTYKLTGNHVFASYVVRIRTLPERLLPDYLVLYLNAPIGRRQIISFATKGVSQANVNASNLGRVLIPLPTIEEQAEIVASADTVRSIRDRIEARQQNCKVLRQSILNETLN